MCTQVCNECTNIMSSFRCHPPSSATSFSCRPSSGAASFGCGLLQMLPPSGAASFGCGLLQMLPPSGAASFRCGLLQMLPPSGAASFGCGLLQMLPPSGAASFSWQRRWGCAGWPWWPVTSWSTSTCPPRPRTACTAPPASGGWATRVVSVCEEREEFVVQHVAQELGVKMARLEVVEGSLGPYEGRIEYRVLSDEGLAARYL
ncbi:unnamed protein product [Closterium sp. NIES-65]|nr:unnamed protein product [Closterium sp. NIES-65]